ncbi:hypothetical protein F511_20086 [Dorcoceras hygrometricum]|uniref:Uncharacterized protein n=1 Tax=Dorcoceras hygrometricum TaxID=472368 RepID=A0A2Z7BVA8_9LAMI|nr:hypothetical protein F511_20086 [Dorcoceras hygrometricum]
MTQGSENPTLTPAQIAELVATTVAQILADRTESQPPPDPQAEEIRKLREELENLRKERNSAPPPPPAREEGQTSCRNGQPSCRKKKPAAGMVNPAAGMVNPAAGKTSCRKVKPDAGKSNQLFIKGPTLLPRFSQKNYSNLHVETLLPSAPAFYQISIKLQTTDSDFNSVNRFEIPMEMAPSAPRTRAATALRMKQITLDNQGRTIRRLRAQLATERRGLATMKKELEDTQVALEASHKVIAGLTEIGLSMSKKIEKMKVKKQLAKANHVECHQKFQARIHEAEDSMQAQHLIIEALVDEKDSLLQTIQGLQEANNAPAPFDGEWEEEPEEEPEEEEIEDIPLGEGEIDDE